MKITPQPRLVAVPHAATGAANLAHHNPHTSSPGHLSNLLWLRINKALAVVQCIAQQQPMGDSVEAAHTDALAGAAVDLLTLALADCTHLETCIH
jgi:hypothetical protein